MNVDNANNADETRKAVKTPLWTPEDERYMELALTLASRGIGCVEPNPAVGAVIVRDGEIIGKGYHHSFGGPHAEVDAIADARRDSKGDTVSLEGASIYVTLEPCCHFGKTPPCTQAIIDAGIKKVVIASVDPSEKVAGKGIAALMDAGIDVQTGLFDQRAQKLNNWFFKFHRTRSPWVIAKWAQTLDGKLAARTGHSKWISGPDARLETHKIRQSSQAIVVGIETAFADDPELTVRLPEGECESVKPRVLSRVVIDSKLRLPCSARMVQTARQTPVWIITADNADPAKIAELEDLGVNVVKIPFADGSDSTNAGQLSLPAFLDFAADQGWYRVMIEGGASILSAFLAENLVDEICVFQTTSFALDDQAVQFKGQENLKVDNFTKNFHFESAQLVGNDVMLKLLR